MTSESEFDAIIIGAGAAGLMCGAVAGQYGKRVLIIDHAEKPAEKVRISGGGRCNFTNIHCGPQNFISDNPHFCRSALSRYTPQDFIEQVNQYGILWHEKTKGQLFCDGRSQEIIDMLLEECDKVGSSLWLGTQVLDIQKRDAGFIVTTDRQSLNCQAVIIASGGLSIPKMGATDFGYKIARQFDLNIVDPIPALVPLTFTDSEKAPLKALAGLSSDVIVKNDRAEFDEALLFTHRGISGPAILQISSYWNPGDMITIDLAPGQSVTDALKRTRTESPKTHPKTVLSQFMPKRLADYFTDQIAYERVADMSDTACLNLGLLINSWNVKPAGSEGFRTAEVTKGGVDTNALSSKTMECRSVPGLYFIGEVVDVTGHLGGHNFQWAWASAQAAGHALGQV